jgi:hypothetical protein
MRFYPKVCPYVNVRWGIVFLLASLTAAAGQKGTAAPGHETDIARKAIISGFVRDVEGPVRGAAVRVQATTVQTKTDDGGRFTLGVEDLGDGPFTLIAWAAGYYTCGPVRAKPGQIDVELVLTAHATVDNPDYAWLPALCQPGLREDPMCCSKCHSRKGTDLYPFLPVDEWLLDAHSQSAVNPRFLSIYTGKALSEIPDATNSELASPEESDPSFESSDQTLPERGPGYKVDFPDSAGNCATCHVPAASFTSPFSVDPTKISGVAAEGVTCDFCHKVWDVQLDPSTGLPFADKPGVFSYEFRRPMVGQQFFAGPFDDVAPGQDTFLALQERSEYCAPCHHGSFNGSIIYDAFGEWLGSRYSDPSFPASKQCQDCHMPTGLTCLIALPDKGARRRAPATIASHLMPGGSDLKHLQRAASLNIVASRENDLVKIKISVRNAGAGHHLPTGSPLRHVMLLISARNTQGQQLTLRSGPRLPQWTGDLTGQPGRVYAKVLEDQRTHVSPTAAFWNPTSIVADTRIPALETDVTHYIFDTTDEGAVRLEARLIYRRAFQDLAMIKGWVDADILMAKTEVLLN